MLYDIHGIQNKTYCASSERSAPLTCFLDKDVLISETLFHGAWRTPEERISEN